jgi:RimJ/RimL family protein N-acetyltransferase
MPPSGPPPDIELRVQNLRLVSPNEDILGQLANLVRRRIHPDDFMPFSVPWTDADPDVAAQNYVSWVKRAKFQSTPLAWKLCFAVLDGNQAIGAKSIHADNFSARRVVSTGSWIGMDYQGQGFGTLMRTAVLSLAFDHLGAKTAVSEAFADNAASCRVNEKMGYGLVRQIEITRRSAVASQNVYELHASEWQRLQHPEVSVRATGDWKGWFRSGNL